MNNSRHVWNLQLYIFAFTKEVTAILALLCWSLVSCGRPQRILSSLLMVEAECAFLWSWYLRAADMILRETWFRHAWRNIDQSCSVSELFYTAMRLQFWVGSFCSNNLRPFVSKWYRLSKSDQEAYQSIPFLQLYALERMGAYFNEGLKWSPKSTDHD